MIISVCSLHMKITLKILILLIFNFVTIISCVSIEEPGIRVACVGDSITYGKTIVHRQLNNYPSKLDTLLGFEYSVENFGVSGYTAMKDSPKPYMGHLQFRKALEYQPDVVFLKLGSNDSKTNIWNAEEFWEDYCTIIHSFLNLESNPEIFIILPIPAFNDKWNIQEDVIEDELIPILMDIAFELDLHVIDMHSPFINHPELTNDGIHPNAEGASLIANIVYDSYTAL